MGYSTGLGTGLARAVWVVVGITCIRGYKSTYIRFGMLYAGSINILSLDTGCKHAMMRADRLPPCFCMLLLCLMSFIKTSFLMYADFIFCQAVPIFFHF